MQLPIDAIKDEFSQTLTQQGAVVVCAATGSGKSTQLPLWASQQGRVLVIEPRRIACTSLSEFVAQQCQSKVGEKIGYAIRFITQYSATTDIIYATPGVALRWFFEDQLQQFDVVMLDEFHERRWDMDLLLALLKQRHQHKLIVTSATLNAQRLATYLSAPILESQGQLYPVTEQYQASDPRAMPSKDQLPERVLFACQQALLTSTGDILVFLPGKAEIQACLSALNKLDALTIGLYSGCSAQAQTLALTKQPQRRIILATNVAETSLTIPNITCVIDSGLERRTHLRLGKTVLGLDAIARDSAKQRLGRAGRTQSGICIRLYGQHAPLDTTTPPEIQRESLLELVLASGCAAQGVHSLEFIDPLPTASLEKAVSQLQHLQAIDDQGLATALGKQLYPLPIDYEYGYLISNLPSNTLRQAAIDLISVLSVPAKVYQLPKDVEGISELAKRLPHGSDIEVAIAAIRGQVDDLLSIDHEAISEAKQFTQQLRDAFALPPLQQAASYDYSALIVAIAKCMPHWVYINKHNRRNGFNNTHVEVLLAKETRVSEQADALLVLDTFALAGKGTKQAKTLAVCNAPLSKKQLLEANIGDAQLIKAHIENHDIVATYQVSYADVLLNEYQQAPTNHHDLITALVQLITHGELLPGASKQLTETLCYTELYNQYHQIAQSLPSCEQFLRQRLTELGVESLEDLELIEIDDLILQQVPSWELTPFMEKFPLEWSLPELKMTVNYQFKAKRIELEYLSGARKDAPKKWELPAWSGFKISYRKASKLVNL